jgi:Arc/MetJ-type ribon-helix-helix transcriptional regulator
VKPRVEGFSLNISINQSRVDFLQACVRSGKFASEAEVVDAVLEMLEGRVRLLSAIQEGTADLEAGRCTEYGPNDFDRFWLDVCAAEEEIRLQQATSK